MEPNQDPAEIPHWKEVSTEPQRRALEEMSLSLTQKLHAMVAEQEERVKAFAAQHNGLSPLPRQQDEGQGDSYEPLPRQQPGLVGQTKPAITNGPAIPTPQPSRNMANELPPRPKEPPLFSPASPKKESTIGSGMMGFFIVLFVIFILRACD